MAQRNRAGRSTAFLLLLALFCLAGPGLCCGETFRGAVFTDDAGRHVRMPDVPARVVSLVPAITEDIRSSYQPRRFAATGTDNIIVAQNRV